jgi:hypothetical protein
MRDSMIDGISGKKSRQGVPERLRKGVTITFLDLTNTVVEGHVAAFADHDLVEAAHADERGDRWPETGNALLGGSWLFSGPWPLSGPPRMGMSSK